MNRREVLAALAAAATPGSWSAAPRQVTFAVQGSEAVRERLSREFARHGYVVGRDLDLAFVDVHDAPVDRVDDLVRSIVASRPEVIAMLAGEPIFAFQRLAGPIPFVFYNLGADPVAMGLVKSIARPGGNITGTSHRLLDMVPKFWELLMAFKPGMTRAAMLTTESVGRQKHYPAMLAVARESASRLRFRLSEILVPDEAPFPAVVDAIRRERAEALLWAEGGSWVHDLIAFAREARLPTAYPSAQLVRRGGLLSITPDMAEGERQAVAIIARILRGERPAEIPVYEATRYHLAVNRRTATAMGLATPASVLLQANEVVD